MQESIISSVFRSFLIKFFGMMGVFLGIIPFIFLLSALFSSPQFEAEITPNFKVEIAANAEGKRKILPKTAPVILKIDINGVIGDKELTGSNFKNLLLESQEGLLEGRSIKAILLSINTPGGTVTDADAIYRALMEYKKQFKIPVYAYVDGLCASGGMFVAAACDKIYSTDSSLIGSVGVITSPFFNVTETMDKIGIKSLVLSAGTGKDELSQFRPWKEGEDAHMKEIIEFYYLKFVELVAKSRPLLTQEKLIEEYGAKVYPAPLAKEYGYIDELAFSESEVLKVLAEQIGIEDSYYQVITLKNSRWLFSLFQEESSLHTGKIEHTFNFSSLPKHFDNQFLYLYLPSSRH